MFSITFFNNPVLVVQAAKQSDTGHSSSRIDHIMTECQPRLIGDIGGTNVRFALALGEGVIVHEHKLPVAEFDNLELAARTYLQARGSLIQDVAEAVFAVATPVRGDEIAFTNNPWRFSIRSTEAALGLKRLEIINDFVAQAASIRVTPDEEMAIIKSGEVMDNHPAVVIGPGTGLGMAFILRHKDGEEILASEGGHCTFSPRDETQTFIRDQLAREYGHVSSERLLSGPGLLAMARALAQRAGLSLALEKPADVTRLAEQEACPVCREAIRVFSAVLGSVAADAVLNLVAIGGVYLIGNVSKSLRAMMDFDVLIEAFLEKGRFRALLNDVPIIQVMRSNTGLLGASAWRRR
ncbi:Glucokinase [Granulibacter bethesdensis]|uniref:Glucokinase n=2 Tax=Granulibacter bethesdensis TaxID=364410 RepID=A0AAC9P895_9PROT|nr:Glucokinase [Granulibacter bethesdensis]APH61858.1 Glucokinase [Granulibacter bethesdensis]